MHSKTATTLIVDNTLFPPSIRQMLAEGGSAIDALIAMSLCLGVYRTTSSGIGGGGFMTIYIK